LYPAQMNEPEFMCAVGARLKRYEKATSDIDWVDEKYAELDALIEDGKVVDMTLESWKGFAGYAFNRAHAASYAILAYRGAYLRTYYPVEWLAACIQTDITGNKQERVGGHIKECDNEKPRIKVVGPDVNLSTSEVSIMTIFVFCVVFNASIGIEFLHLMFCLYLIHIIAF